MVFRKGSFLTTAETRLLGGAVVEVVKSCKHTGLPFSTPHSFTVAMEDTSIRAKTYCTREILRELKRGSCHSPEILFKCFDAQVASTLLYHAHMWGYRNDEQRQTYAMYLFAWKTLFA